MPDALPGTTLSIYPGFGQALNMLVCIPGGLVSPFHNGNEYRKPKSNLLIIGYRGIYLPNLVGED